MRRRSAVPALLLPCLLMAQPVIDQSDMPAAGDVLNRTQAAPNPFLDFATTGPAQVWDFSDLTAAAGEATAYQSVSSTNFVYAIAFADVFFNPNRSNHARSGSDIPFYQLLPIDNPYTFFYSTGSLYKKTGYGVELSGLPVPIALSQHDVIYNLPLNYGDSDVGNSAYAVDLPTLAYYGYEQVRANEVDGWGSVTTPSGSFDVLRVKTTINGRDTVQLDTLNLGFAIDRPTVREYKWLAHGFKVPILQVNTTEFFGTEVVTQIFYYDEPHTITVAPPLAATACPGSTFTLNYEVTGTYNVGGFFIPANEFTAQLSDAAGDFSAPVELGTVTATTSGAITVTIPPGTPPGTGYRIRVVANSPVTIGEDNGFDIAITNDAPTAGFTVSGATTFCAGASVMFTADPVSAELQWLQDGSPINGANGTTLEVTASGTYTLEVSNACGTDLADDVVVTVGELPAHAVPQSPLVTCAGQPVEIVAEDQSGQTGLTFQWFRDGEAIDGANAASILVAEAGAYTLEITQPTTGCTYTTETVEVVVEGANAPQVAANGPLTFCSGGAVELSTTDGSTWQWYQDGNAIDGATASTLVVVTSGAYTVVTTSDAGCVSEPSAPAVVNVVVTPGTPEVLADGDLTFCDGGVVVLSTPGIPGASYQWSLNGDVLAGAENDSLVVTTAGTYGVTITLGAGCSASSTDNASVVVNPLPDQPVITQNADSLLTTGTGTFQWYLDGSPITDATATYVLPTQSGTYTVVVTDANGCTATSEPFIFISTAVGGQGAEQTPVIWPNPTDGVLTLRAPSTMAGATFIIRDLAGRSELSGRVGASTTIGVDHLAQGSYLLQVVEPNGRSSVLPFVKR
jgi:hypothetical protein